MSATPDDATSASPPADASAPSTRELIVKPATPLQRAIQVVGLIVGIALLVWALRLALSPENQEQLARLREAKPGPVVALVVLSLLSLALDAAVFWITLAPRRRLPKGETLAANSIAVFLSILPFKLGMIVRSAIHIRRHGVPLKELISWFIAFGGISVASIVACAGGALLAARLESQPSLVLIATLTLALLAGAWCVIVAGGQIALRAKSDVLRKLALGTADLLADPRATAAGLLARALDVATFAARFALAAVILGIPLSWPQSAQLGSVYLILQAGAPAGALGFAEAGTAGAGQVIGMDKNSVALLALMVTAIRMLTAGACAVAAWAWLRPHRLLRSR